MFNPNPNAFVRPSRIFLIPDEKESSSGICRLSRASAQHSSPSNNRNREDSLAEEERSAPLQVCLLAPLL